MNRTFDYNGVQIAPSKAVQKLTKRTRVLHIDSGDRDTGIFPNNGNYTIYLPRAYERVTGITVKSAEFPPSSTLRQWTGPDKQPTHSGVALASTPVYFFLEAKGLNMSDETTLSADRSASTNSVFAKFVLSTPNTSATTYNESSDANQEIEFFPALTKLDRLQFRLRTHSMTSNEYMYWPSGGGEWSISLEIQTLENAFDEFSTIETRLGDRS